MEGDELVTVEEANSCSVDLCENGILGQWDIVQLADGRMNGQGYGCTVTTEMYSGDHKLCRVTDVSNCVFHEMFFGNSATDYIVSVSPPVIFLPSYSS